MTIYPMRRWVFEDSLGRYDIDLGDSHVQCATLDQLRLPAALELGYGVDRGGAELREQVARRYGGDPERVLVTHGAQEALYLLYATLLRPGDRVLAFRPGWQQATDAPARLGAEVLLSDLTEDFGLDLDQIAALAEGGLRLITLNTPGNPSGRRITTEELAAVLAIAERAGAYVLADEEYLVDLTESVALAGPRTVSVSSLSKVAGLPGLRVGWMYGPPEIVAACAEYKHLTTISTSVLCESLATQALANWQHYRDEYQRLTALGHRQLLAFVDRNAGLMSLVPPQGTPFAWLQLAPGLSSMDLARDMLDVGVLLMPGDVLGKPGGIRITFAREGDVLTEGLARFDSVLSTRSQKRSVQA
ncbi:MAG TPA: pyridoxal phosphate-dependent aminotransferase [Jatrophihabitans sp.]|nr:pyridoxal phosphate-dependent aminotransferase [Jatrophihabitans sp.]